MNGSIIRKILGYVLVLEGVLLLMPGLVGLYYHEEEYKTYLICATVTFAIGAVVAFKKTKNNVFYLKEGCTATALSWIVLSVFGAVPFVLTGEIPHFVDALFETVSGFTTTGASILTDVEALSHASLFWRSFTHWIGGMGVLVFLLAVVQMTGGSNMNLMRAESPGPSVGSLFRKCAILQEFCMLCTLFLLLLKLCFLFAVICRFLMLLPLHSVQPVQVASASKMILWQAIRHISNGLSQFLWHFLALILISIISLCFVNLARHSKWKKSERTLLLLSLQLL